jgi:hypothetical protein
MRRIALVFALFAMAVPAIARAQAAPSACPSTATLDELVTALDAAISGPANKDRTCLRQLFVPEARLSPIVQSPDGSYAPRILSVEDWISSVARRGSTPLYEVQVKVERLAFEHFAHLWCHYEIRATSDGPATVTGINSIQAVFDGAHWRVLSVLWEPGSTATAEKK